MTQQPLTRDEAVTPRSDARPSAQRPRWKQPPLSWGVGFIKFWYRFIVGDDWTLAATVALGLVVTALLHARGVSLWWLVPAIVIAIVGVDLERASRRLRKR